MNARTLEGRPSDAEIEATAPDWWLGRVAAPRSTEQKASHAARRSDDTEHAHTSLSLALKASDAALQAMDDLTPTLLVSDCLEMLAKAHTLIEEAKGLYGKWEPLSAIEYEGRKL